MQHRTLRTMAGLAIVVIAMSACSTTTEPTSGADDKPLQVRAGMNDPEDLTIAVMSFLPADFTVPVDAEVEWTFPGPEPHSVSFFPEGEEVPTPDQALPFFPGDGNTGTVDGSAVVNSGVRPTGAPADTFIGTFPTAGTFAYVCVIHPQMVGAITVTDDGEVDTQATLDESADSLVAEYLAEGRAAKAAYVAADPRSETKNGKTTWYLEMGTTTPHTDILAFAPVDAAIKAGDTVVFINNSMAPHTASFAGEGELPQSPESDDAVNAVPGPSPQTLNATDVFNTGWLPPNAPPGAGPPEAVRSFSFVVPEAGEYGYICILHVPSGMTGKISAT